MSLIPSLPAAILDTVLGRLAIFFLTSTAGDMIAARHAAQQMLAAYHPETPGELSLAAEIVSFSFHALETLGQAADPDMSLNRKLRLRGSAVSLSREAHKSQRKLDQLQKARHAGIPTQPVQTQDSPAEAVPCEIDATPARPKMSRSETPAKARNPGQTWTQAYQQRQAAKRIAENLKKNAALHVPGAAAIQNPAAIPGATVSHHGSSVG